LAQLILLGAGLILGAILCFNGYNLFRFSLAVAGGVLGYVGGTFLCRFIESTGTSLSDTAKLIIPLVPAIILAITSFALYLKALIAITSLLCAYFVYTDYGALFPGQGPSKPLMPILAGFVIGLIMGVVVYFAQKWTISFLTAFIGARVIAMASSTLIWNLLRENPYALYIQDSLFGTRVTDTPALTSCFIIVAFTAAGFAFQLKTTKKEKDN
jgi:hypothetical protein